MDRPARGIRALQRALRPTLIIIGETPEKDRTPLGAVEREPVIVLQRPILACRTAPTA